MDGLILIFTFNKQTHGVRPLLHRAIFVHNVC